MSRRCAPVDTDITLNRNANTIIIYLNYSRYSLTISYEIYDSNFQLNSECAQDAFVPNIGTEHNKLELIYVCETRENDALV